MRNEDGSLWELFLFLFLFLLLFFLLAAQQPIFSGYVAILVNKDVLLSKDLERGVASDLTAGTEGGHWFGQP